MANPFSDGRPRHCFKCKTIFAPTDPFTSVNTRQCPSCAKQAAANPWVDLRRFPKTSGHTTAWDKASLGLVEANILRMAWGPEAASFVIRNSNTSADE